MKLRFTNRAIKALFDSSAIDLMHLSGDALVDPASRVAITAAGLSHDSTMTTKKVAALCDELTPGEHIDLLREAIQRDLMPASLREATAKAAASPKSEEPAAA